MRLLVALAAAALALVAWLAFAPRAERAQDVREERAPAAAPAASNHETLDVAPNVDVPRRAPESAAASTPPANASGPRTRIHGRVVDDLGYGIGGALVLVREWAAFPDVLAKHETRTLHDGAFELVIPTPTSERQSITVTAEPFHLPVEIWYGLEQVGVQRKFTPVELAVGSVVLQPCGTVEGRVLTEGGQPVARVLVRLLADGQVAQGAQTDEFGRYVAEHLARAKWFVTIHDEDWLPPEKVFVEVVTRHVTAAPDLILTSAPTIEGVVVERDGTPVPNVSITAGRPSMSGLTHTTALPDGSFTLKLPVREPMAIWLRAQRDFMAFKCPHDDPRCTFQPGARGVRIVLERAPRITFRVVDAATQKPIENFGIRLRRTDREDVLDGTLGLLDPQFHADGAVELAISARSWVEVAAAGFARAKLMVESTTAGPSVQTIALDPGSSITGRVVVDGKPAAGASIVGMHGPRTIEGKAGAKAFSSSARADDDGQFATQTNDQGEFVFADLPADVFALRISFGDSPPRTLDGLIVPRAGTLALGDVELARGATLRGVVRTAEGDSPVGFSVALDTGEMVRVREADGRFELTGLAPGAHWLQWWRGDSQFQRHRVDFDVAAGETRELVIDAVASAPCRIEVRVRRNGQPAANVPVIAVPAAKGKGSAYLGTTNAEGVVIGQVEGGVRVIVQALSAAKRAIGAAPAELVTVAGGSLACTIDVECGTLSLELPVELARPENGRVMIQFADGTSLQALTSSGAPTGPKEFVAGPLRWSTNRIDFGEVPAGTRDAEVRVERYERAPDSDNPKLGTWVLLREPYKTKIAVQDGGATHVVVP